MLMLTLSNCLGLGGENLVNIEKGKVKTEVKKAMYIELTEYWRSIGEARITKSIHPQWEYRRLSSVMNTRYTHCMLHNLALGRAKLRWTIHRRKPHEMQLCRHGCGVVENLNHMIFECKKIECYRKIWRKQCLEIEKEFNLQTLFCEPELREDLEKSFVIFFNIF